MSSYSDSIDESGVIDITTIGAKTGRERRIEINFVHIEGRYYITGRPGRKRDWQANLKANPDFTVHLKGDTETDIPAVARLVSDTDERADILYRILTEGWDNEPSKARHILPRWVDDAPLIEFEPAG